MRTSPVLRKRRLHDILENTFFLGFTALLWCAWPALLRSGASVSDATERNLPPPFASFLGPQDLSNFLPATPALRSLSPDTEAGDHLKPGSIPFPALTEAGIAPSEAKPAQRFTEPRPILLDRPPETLRTADFRLPRVRYPMETTSRTEGLWTFDVPPDINIDEAELFSFTTGVTDRAECAVDLFFRPDGTVETVLFPPELTAFSNTERSALDRLLHKAENLSQTNLPVRIRWSWQK